MKDLEKHFYFSFFFKDFLFIYLRERDTAREGTQAGGVGEGEANSPRSREQGAGSQMRGSIPGT